MIMMIRASENSTHMCKLCTYTYQHFICVEVIGAERDHARLLPPAYQCVFAHVRVDATLWPAASDWKSASHL